MIPSLEAVRAISRERNDAIVVSTMSPNRYWEAVTENPDLDLPIFGAMGKASSVALGLALARPEKKVLVLDGDGGLLMNLGTLVTIAGQEPENLVHFLFEDGVYFTTGSQPVPGAGRVSLSGMAKDAGFRHSPRVRQPGGLRQRAAVDHEGAGAGLRLPEGRPPVRAATGLHWQHRRGNEAPGGEAGQGITTHQSGLRTSRPGTFSKSRTLWVMTS